MANVYKNIQAKVTSAGSYDDMYESPSATTSIVKSVKLFNSHSGATVYADKYMSTTMPAFMAHPSTSQNAFAENAAVTIVMGNERFDQGTNFASNTFTAPVTGRYQFNVQIQIKDAEIAYTYYQLILVTSNVNYVSTIDPRSFDQDVTLLPLGLSILADMDASDTAYVQVLAGGTAGGAGHDLLEQSYFSGYLVC